jgi:hypothetical protein
LAYGGYGGEDERRGGSDVDAGGAAQEVREEHEERAEHEHEHEDGAENQMLVQGGEAGAIRLGRDSGREEQHDAEGRGEDVFEAVAAWMTRKTGATRQNTRITPAGGFALRSMNLSNWPMWFLP